MGINFGDIYLADLDPVKGSEQGGLRPVLIFQNTKLNEIFNTVFIIPITSQLKAKGYMLTYFLDKTISGLDKDSVCLIFQPRTISKQRLIKKVGEVSKNGLECIKIELEKIYN